MSADVSRRAVACKRFRLMPGMVGLCGWRIKDVRADGSIDWGEEWTERPSDIGDWLPDLDDPATRGCLLALVREAWGDPGCCPSHDGITWVVNNSNLYAVEHGYHESEAEALLAALEAAP